MKKALSVFLSAVLVFTLCPAFASAEEIPTTDPEVPSSVEPEVTDPVNPEPEDSTVVYVDSEISLKVGATTKLSISTEPAGEAYTCTSSDESVVEVTNSGMLYAVAAGEADVTVTSGEATAVCHVVVIDYVGPDTMAFTKKSVSMVQGNKMSTSLNINPVDADVADLAFESSNASVATVDAGGVITAVKAGTATITATAGNASATCTVTVVLPKPTGVTAKTSGLTSVTVKWSKVANANGYLVYRSTAKNGTYKLVKTVTSGSTLSFKNTSLTKGKTYYYKVKARNANTKYNSAFSSVVSAKATYLAPTMKQTANATSSSVKVSWTKVSGAKGYYVYRKKGSGSWTRIKTITSVNTLTYKDTKASGVCRYAVAAYGKVNGKVIVGVRAAEAVTRTLAAPKTIDASTSTSSVRHVNWSAVTGATGYQIYCKAGDNASWTLAATVGNKTSHDVSIRHGIYYYVKVRAIYKSSTGTTYGPFKSTTYGWLRYCDPDLSALMLSDTDTNCMYMAMSISNDGSHPVRFYSEGARWVDGEGYTGYNRNLHLVNDYGNRLSYVNIPAHSEKILMFKVSNNNPTWYDKWGKIKVKFRYDGMYYWAHCSPYYSDYYVQID